MTATLPNYEGWVNRPTWSVNLWLTNDQYTDSELRRICNRGSVYESTQALQEWVEEMMDETLSGASLQSDLLSWALAYVDWREIVENNREEEEEEENHVHVWGDVELSRFSGTPHRKCACGEITLDLDDEDEEEENA